MKIIAVFLVFIMCALSFVSCGNVAEVLIVDSSSEIYSEDDIDSAIYTAVSYFRRHFDGCTLTEIGYAGDDEIEGYREFAVRNGADEVIVLTSKFDVGTSGGDGSLNPNSTYTGWKWILVRKLGGTWRHVDLGY